MSRSFLLRQLGILVFSLLSVSFIFSEAEAQVSSVEFGKNRIQYRKYKWRFYQTPNFNVHFNEGGLELAKFVLQIAEEELGQIENFTENGLQRRANIILYNSYDDLQATNVGLVNNVPDVGGLTRLVNNKMLVYFDANHAELRRQVREGIARILVDNRLMGENIGEMAGNAALLDLPKWLTDGYVAYTAQDWNTQMDDRLKNALLGRDYRNFYQFAFKEPDLAGHAFWKYIADNYKRDNVTYFMYLATLYRNLNSASVRICKKKFKDVLADFMEKESEKYNQELRGRRNMPKGSIAITEDISEKRDFFRFAPNPNPRSYTYAVAEYIKGFYRVALYENYTDKKVLIKNGVRTLMHERNPNYPIMSWDGRGTRLAVVFWEKGKTKLMIRDLVNPNFNKTVELPFDQVQDANYFLDHKRLVMSAVRNGHTDLFVYYIETGKVDQLTNDVWDDLDASYVTFPNKSGFIFSSNRPGPDVTGTDTSLPSSNRYNVFLADYDEKAGFRQVTQLTNMPFGNARYPMQYNVNHYTFVSDQNGIANRYAGFFTTQGGGIDTLLFIGEEILRNPSPKEVDSTLKAWDLPEPDSVGFINLTRDSTYAFPITNYQSSLLETRNAGDRGQVSEVTQQSDLKMLYRLRVDSIALKRRNITPRPTEYMRLQMLDARAQKGQATIYKQPVAKPVAKDTTNKGFITEFEEEIAEVIKDSSTAADFFKGLTEKTIVRQSALDKAKLYKYKLRFSNDYLLGGVSNNIIINRFQPYGGGAGPIQLNNGNNISWAFLASISDVMEDYRISGGVKPGINFRDNEYFISYDNFRKRIDWGLLYYRGAASFSDNQLGANGRLFTNIYQGKVVYPIDRVRSFRFIPAFRFDRFVVQTNTNFPPGLALPDATLSYLNFRLEYVHDDVINKAQNIWNGLRYKVYGETIMQTKRENEQPSQRTYNVGADFRYYYPIYRNFIWAGRAAVDASWGNQKLIYYLGGIDSWISPRFENANRPNPSVNYVYQTLAVNMRGYRQNMANGNNAMVINSEFRFPVFSTLFNKPINNALLRNFQLTQFIDLGTAWEGTFRGLARPSVTYATGDANNPVRVTVRTPGIGPFAGGYGFGARSTLLGYLLKVDAAWQMNGLFRGRPIWYFSLGLDF
ncbi:MAG: hypothetical protein MUF24_05835 [Chitinophagaceae bacterium]|nr:hypothetical protein [Chitinophagaceae bacterium]